MIGLTRFELKKAMGRRLIWVILAILLVLNGVNIERHHHIFSTDPMAQGRYELYTELRGELTDEKLALIQSYYSEAQKILSGAKHDTEYDPERYFSGFAYGDANLWNEIKEECDRIQAYQGKMKSIVNAASEANQNSSLALYYRRQNAQIATLYAGRSLHELSRLEGITALSEYRFSTVLLLLMLILIAGNLYVTERETGMSELLCSFRSGGSKTAAAKLFAVLLITGFLCTLFFVMDFILFCFYYRIDGLSLPVYAVPPMDAAAGFEESPLSCTVWQYLLLSGAMRLLGFWVFASAFAAISAAMRLAEPVFFSTVLLTVSLMLCYTFWNTGAGIAVNTCNPLRLLLTDFRHYEVYNIGENPVSVPLIAVCAGLLFFTGNSILCMIAGRRRV